MCLNEIDKECRYRDDIYWKVFRVLDDGCLKSEYCDRKYKVGKWYRKRKNEPGAIFSPIIRYEPGFHAFVTKEEAEIWYNYNHYKKAIRRVELRGVRLSGQVGYGHKLNVVVADRMKILEEV